MQGAAFSSGEVLSAALREFVPGQVSHCESAELKAYEYGNKRHGQLVIDVMAEEEGCTPVVIASPYAFRQLAGLIIDDDMPYTGPLAPGFFLDEMLATTR
jgi:hypothetical protein